MSVKFSSLEVERFVQEQVQSGAFPSVDAVLEAAVTQMMRESDEGGLTDEDWEAIRRADEEIDRGEYVDFETARTQLLAKYGRK